MNKNPKKRVKRTSIAKVLTMVIALILALGITITGTLAYMDSLSDVVSNTFVAGNIEYTLNLDANKPDTKGNVEMPTVTEGAETYVTQTFNLDKNPTLTGYTFEGWYYDANTTEKYSEANINGTNIVVKLTDEHDSDPAEYKVEVTLYAKWEPIVYTVKYDGNGANGGQTNDSQHTYDVTTELNENGYTRVGYKFIGWKYELNDKTYNNKEKVVNLTTVDNGVVTLKAQWEAQNVNYVVNHWQQKIDADKATNDTNYTKVKTETKQALADSKVTPGVESYEGFTSPTSKEVTVKPDGSLVVDYYYARNSYTVTLNKGTGISEVSGVGTYHYGKEVTISATVAKGYKWAEWTGSKGTTSQSYTFTMPASNVTNTAKVTPISYTVVYEKNGKDSTSSDVKGTTNSSQHTYDVAKALTTNGYTRTGYTFIGWNTKADGSGKNYANGESVTNLTATDGATIKLYAQWGAKSYIIRYHANGGKGSMVDQTIKYDVPTSLSANAFTKDDYTFYGWALTPTDDTDKKVYSDEQIVTNLREEGVLDLYAIWVQNPHTVYFNYNGGKGSPESQPFFNGKSYGTLPEYPIRDRVQDGTWKDNAGVEQPYMKSYLFTGWYTKPTGGERVYPTDIVNRTDDHTLYAQWVSAPTNNVIQDITVRNNPDDNKDGVVDDVYLNFTCSSYFEKFNIPLTNLVKGQQYKLVYTASNNASFGDHYNGYAGAVYGSYIVENAELQGGLIKNAVAEQILATYNDRKEPDNINDGSHAATNDSRLQGPFKNKEIIFTATKNTMYWTWDMGLMQDHIKNDYNITDIKLVPVEPKIGFANKTVLKPTGSVAKVASQTNSAYSTNFVFDGDGGCETLYYPITGLSKGVTYTITFDHKMSGAFVNSASYDHGSGITNGVPGMGSLMSNLVSDKVSWLSKNPSTHVFKTLNTTTSNTLTFTATSDTAYWVWNMANCSDSTNCTIDIKVTSFKASGGGNSHTFYSAASAAVLAVSEEDGQGSTYSLRKSVTPTTQTPTVVTNVSNDSQDDEVEQQEVATTTERTVLQTVVNTCDNTFNTVKTLVTTLLNL